MEVEGEAALGRMVVPEGPDSSGLGWQQEQSCRTVGILQSCSYQGWAGWGQWDGVISSTGTPPCGTEGGGQAGKSGAFGRAGGAE